jgi:hypothetical protein
MKSYDEVVANKEHFIGIYKPIAGWKCIMLSFDEEIGGYAPLETGMTGWHQRELAVTEGKLWADSVGIEFFDRNVM